MVDMTGATDFLFEWVFRVPLGLPQNTVNDSRAQSDGVGEVPQVDRRRTKHPISEETKPPARNPGRGRPAECRLFSVCPPV